MSPTSRRCDEATIAGRMRKADEFMRCADLIREFSADEREIGDAYVTLCVHAGIAASDVICCLALGEHSKGDDHREALGHLRQIQPEGKQLAKLLGTLLATKTKAGYSHRGVTVQDRKRAERAAGALLQAAHERRARA